MNNLDGFLAGCRKVIYLTPFFVLVLATANSQVFMPKQGIVVVVNPAEPVDFTSLTGVSGSPIYFYLPPQDKVQSHRKAASQAGLLGQRVYVEALSEGRWPLADHLADCVVFKGGDYKRFESEAVRILRPGGKLVVNERVVYTKPFPEGVDDWSHPYHGPDNNPRSKDRVATGPYLTQFLADPRYAPLPQVAVASNGRVFKAFGHISFKEREEPWLNTLAAFNGFNGALLWRREIPPSIMVHRNTLIADQDRLFYADDQSCKILDAESGEPLGEIEVALDSGKPAFWKWMALQNKVLYAMVGDQEQRDPVIRLRRDKHGWPWNPLSPGFNQPDHPWGYGNWLIAFDPDTKETLWKHKEETPMDSRALCMNEGRIYLFSFGNYLACLEASSGKELWRKTPRNQPELFEALGDYLNRQDWRTNWRTTAYVKCNEQALYFSGPQVSCLLAVSAETGEMLWRHPYSNYQLVLFEDGVYGLSGQIDTELSRKFDPLTGRVLEEISMARRACTRPTGAMDAIFCRANGGSARLSVEDNKDDLVSPMRAQCQDGVTIANGLLYWWPSTCDCNLSLYGITSLGPAGSFDFGNPIDETSPRFEGKGKVGDGVISIPVHANDWPMFRRDKIGSMTTHAPISEPIVPRWSYSPGTKSRPTAPTMGYGLCFVGYESGQVIALDAGTGKQTWAFETGGEIRIPPSLWGGKAYVGSGDGWVYCLNALNGNLLWRFRAAPVERRIPVYGRISSTWPVHSGILIEDGVAYFAAGIVNYDGTHVYALNASDGSVVWENHASGHLDGESMAGVSAQGHLMLHDNKLYLAGGNAVSPGIYDIETGTCLNEVENIQRRRNNNVLASESPRGWELYLLGDQVRVSGKPYYSHPEYPVHDNSVFQKTFVTTTPHGKLAWINNETLVHLNPEVDPKSLNGSWGNTELKGIQRLWTVPSPNSLAIVVGEDRCAVALKDEIQWIQLTDGKILGSQPLDSEPVLFGMAVDHRGVLVVTQKNGGVVGFRSDDSPVELNP